MAKDTEKLIRQLSLISYLMAERRPVTAPEIRRDVEGYSAMNEDAFARRFYADRSELEALGIQLSVDKPVEGARRAGELLAAAGELPPAGDRVQRRRAGRPADGAGLLDGEFAYAEPLRLALQQISWGRSNPLQAPEQRSIALGITASAGGHDLSQRLAKIETAIFRRKTIVFDYYTMQRDELGSRKVDPYQLLFQGGQFYLVGRAHERDDIRVFRLSRIRGKVAYASKAEHDFQRPDGVRPALLRQPHPVAVRRAGRHRRGAHRRADRAGRSSATSAATARCAPADDGSGDRVFATEYADARQLVAWVLGLGEHARLVGPPELVEELEQAARRCWSSATRRARAGGARSRRRATPRRSSRRSRTGTAAARGRRDPPGALRAARDARARS